MNISIINQYNQREVLSEREGAVNIPENSVVVAITNDNGVPCCVAPHSLLTVFEVMAVGTGKYKAGRTSRYSRFRTILVSELVLTPKFCCGPNVVVEEDPRGFREVTITDPNGEHIFHPVRVTEHLDGGETHYDYERNENGTYSIRNGVPSANATFIMSVPDSTAYGSLFLTSFDYGNAESFSIPFSRR